MSLTVHATAARIMGDALDRQALAAESLARASSGSQAEHLTYIAIMLRHQANAHFDAANRMVDAERAMFAPPPAIPETA